MCALVGSGAAGPWCGWQAVLWRRLVAFSPDQMMIGRPLMVRTSDSMPVKPSPAWVRSNGGGWCPGRRCQPTSVGGVGRVVRCDRKRSLRPPVTAVGQHPGTRDSHGGPPPPDCQLRLTVKTVEKWGAPGAYPCQVPSSPQPSANRWPTPCEHPARRRQSTSPKSMQQSTPCVRTPTEPQG